MSPLYQTAEPVELPERTPVERFALPSGCLFDTGDLRMDASHFNPVLLRALESLNTSGMQIETLDSVVSRVFMPPRFRRIYVGKNEGLPFLQGSHVVRFRLDDVKFLSRASHRDMAGIVIEAGWILVTRSGTVGRAAICPPDWDGWAASEHIIRILPDNDKCPAGYLCSFLSSSLGHAQLTAQIYGAVVDEITEQQVRDVLIPLPKTKADKQMLQLVDTEMQKAISQRSEASEMVSATIDRMPKNEDASSVSRTEHFSLPATLLQGSDEARMDASNYSPALLRSLRTLHDYRMPAVPLGSIVTSVFMPPRFKRVYVEPKDGHPFLRGSHVVHFQPADIKHLSPSAYDNIDELLVKSGWILVTRSGTVGRVTICPREWDGWTATEDIIRILPDEDKCPSGYLYAFLASALGQVQFTSQIHGAVVDHLTEQNVKDVLVPVPRTRKDHQLVDSIDSTMKDAFNIRSSAVDSAEESVRILEGKFLTDSNNAIGINPRYEGATPEMVGLSLLRAPGKDAREPEHA